MDADLADLDELMAESNAKARRGRRIARLIFAVAMSFVALVAFLITASPNTMGPEPARWPLVAGIVGAGVGLFWMIRIIRADREPDSAAWRYRDR